LENRIREVRQDPASHILDDDTLEAKLATFRSGGDLSELSQIRASLPDLIEIAREVNLLLSQTASNRAIERLERNADLESWVRQGLKLHQDASICEFCRSPLSKERMEELRGHFSEAYESLMRELTRKVEELRSLSFDFACPDEARLIPDTRQSFTDARNTLESWIEWAKRIRDQMVEALEEKQKAIENQTEWGGDLTRASEGNAILQELNNAIKEHNRLLSDLGKTKAEVKADLEKHYAALHYQENEIEEKQGKVADLKKKVNRSNSLGDRIGEKIQEIEKKISRSAIGAKKLNELLKYLLASSDIEVKNVGESEFQFLRGGQVATNLSDGEKTALTLAYFLTSLEAEGASIEDAIVFVDDPVSSLDSNHIYATYALITERLKRCHQVFVSTHNSEFFNLLKSCWLGKKGGNRDDSSAYWVRREVRSDGTVHARLEDLPQLLRKYRSEYEFVFSKLYEFQSNASPSEHEAYTAPNLLRKFLEAYLGFRKPDVRAWHDKLDLLIDSPEKRREVQKFADDASHLQSLGRSRQQPDFVASSQSCVRDVLEALKAKDEEHYLSLERVVNGRTP
jgi:wobble nucleotide-excising tRNase